MKLKCALYVVKDIKRSRKFYEEVLGQKVKYDFGENVTYEGDFSIQEHNSFAKMTTIDEEKIISKTNNAEIYFETSDLDLYVEKLEGAGVEFIHKIIEHSWGQRVIRFYDLDMHIVEIGECMELVILRFLDNGYTIEETVKLSQHSESFIRECIKNR